MNQIPHYTLFLLPNSTIEVGSLLLDVIFVFLIIENTFQIEAIMSYGGFALSSEQDVFMHFGFSHTLYAKLRHSFTKKHRQF